MQKARKISLELSSRKIICEKSGFETLISAWLMVKKNKTNTKGHGIQNRKLQFENMSDTFRTFN